MSETLIETLKKDEGLLQRATQIKTRKGTREKSYTLGYGYNLSAHDSPRQDLIEAGVDEDKVDDVLAGRADIDEVQATSLLNITAVRAKRDAMRVVPNFDKLPSEVQDVVVSMSYQLGAKGLRRFKQFREALYLGDYEKAAKEVLNSDFARDDAPNRAKRHADALRKAAKAAKANQQAVPSHKEKVDTIKKELLLQRALKVRQSSPDPLVPRLAELFSSMKPAEKTPNVQENVDNASP